jgi:hypothetical protein
LPEINPQLSVTVEIVPSESVTSADTETVWEDEGEAGES